MKVSSISQMRSLDKRAIEEFGIKGELLMENAGLAAYYALKKEFNIQDQCFLIFCGIGNNGGDGCVLARKIHSDGGRVKVFLLGNPGKFKGAARRNFEIITRLPVESQQISSHNDMQEEIMGCNFIVDAILGTGLSRNVEGLYRDVIGLINNSGKPILSVDIPSGVQGDTGRVMGIAVKANFTVTFGLPKYGNVLFPGCEFGGKLYLSHISFPRETYTADNLKVEINQPFTNFPPKAEKPVAESKRALYLLGTSDFGLKAFLKLGKSQINVVDGSPRSQKFDLVEDRIHQLHLRESRNVKSPYQDNQELLQSATQVDMVILSPGFSQNIDDKNLVPDLLYKIKKPMIVTGDNLFEVYHNWDWLFRLTGRRVFLLDTKGLSVFFGISIQEVDDNKINLLQQASEMLNSIIVLLDTRLLIGFPDHRVFINLSGSNLIDTKGLWEGLDGTITAMYSLGLSFEDAIKQGVFIHGLAGDLIAKKSLNHVTIPQDFLSALSQAQRMAHMGLDKDIVNRYSGAEVI